MKTVKGYICTDKVGSECEFEFDVYDDCSDDEIEEIAREHAFNLIEWGYKVKQTEN